MTRARSDRSRGIRGAKRLARALGGERNRLLLALPHVEYTSLIEGLEPVPFRLRDVLYEPGAAILHAYFPQHGDYDYSYTFSCDAWVTP
jgi:hypothetical protein